LTKIKDGIQNRGIEGAVERDVWGGFKPEILKLPGKLFFRNNRFIH
jgi:hypothetical protein